MDGVTKYNDVEKNSEEKFGDILKRKFYLNRANKALMKVYKEQESIERHINEKNFKKTQQWKERDNREKVIKSKAIFSIILGIVLIGTFLVIDFSFVQSSDSVYQPFFSSLLNVISMITSMIVGIGVSTLCLDFFSYVQYTRERLKEIVVEKDFIETLADDEKKELVDKLEKSLYFRSEKELSRSLYENIKARIIPLLEEPYLERYTIHIDCYIDEEEGTIKKKFHREMIICSLEDNYSYKLPFSMYMKRINGVEDKDLYKINECLFRKQVYTEEMKCEVCDHGLHKGSVQFYSTYEFNLRKGNNIIEMQYETIVPISDLEYCHYVSMACKNYSASFSIHNDDKYRVNGHGFVLDDISNRDGIDVVKKVKQDNTVFLTMGDWVMPGEGCAFFIIPKGNENVEKFTETILENEE